MFDFLRRPGVRTRVAAVRCALERDGLPPGIDIALELGVVESQDTYAGRRVTRVRVFDPARAAEGGLHVRRFGDLDAHPDLVLRTGHIEQDGTVVISWRADRGLHADDERIVFAGVGARLGARDPRPTRRRHHDGEADERSDARGSACAGPPGSRASGDSCEC